MSLRILLDMNLSPDWVDELIAYGYDTVHWSSVGDPRDTDRKLMDWAQSQSRVVLTHDLDFGTILALTRRSGPSVIQVRTQNVLPDHLLAIVLAALQQHEAELTTGALVVVDESKSRVRVLPF